MTYSFATGKRPCALEIVLKSDSARNIFVTGYDTANNDPYFRRICELQPGKRHIFYFGMPISPVNLKVIIFDEDNRVFSRPETYQVVKPRLVKLRTANVPLNRQSADFLKFAEWLSVNMPTLPTGKTFKLDDQFEVQLFDDLDTSTPARIHSTGNFIQVSKEDFLTMTIPRRVVILLHEFAHNYLNQNPEDESEADINALTIYLSKGYPFMEAVYAFTKIFHDNNQSVERLHWMNQFMRKHSLFIDR